MENLSDGQRKIILSIFIPILIITLAAAMWFIYFFMFLKNDLAIVTSYIDNATYSEDEKYFLNVDYFSNENENGIENFGVRLAYYTDTGIPEQKEDGSYGEKYMYSTGVQFKNGAAYTKRDNTNWFTYSYSYISLRDCFYYNSMDNGKSFAATDSLEDMNHWVYDVDGQLCLIEEKGNAHEYNTLWVKRGTCYDTSMLVADLYDVVKTLPDGEQVIVLDLSKYYNVYLFDGSKFDRTEPTSVESYVFVQCYVNKTSNGLTSAEQSMFKSYMGDTKWSLFETGTADYWQARIDYELNLQDFTFVVENGKYMLKLQSACVNYLKEYKNLDLYITIDLDNVYLADYKINIDGFAKDCFSDFNVAEITLKSTETRNFFVYQNYNIKAPNNITIHLLEVRNA